MMKTVRQIAGLAPVEQLDPSRTALILIDFQREYFDGKLPLPDGPAALAVAEHMVRTADRLGLTVIHVHQVATSCTAPLFAPGSGGAEPVRGMVPADHHLRVVKRLPSSFAGTELANVLKERSCDTLIICGLMTHNCVDATTRDALNFGFAPIVAGDACATRDLPGAAGAPPVSARQLHDAVLAGLADRIAEVLSTEQILTLLTKGRAGKD